MRALNLNCTLEASPEWSTTHALLEVAQSLIDIGDTVPAPAWTYWNMGPGPGPSYLETDHEHDWSEKTGRTAASNLVAVARALTANSIPANHVAR